MKLPMRVIEGWSCRWLLLLTLIAGMVEPLAQGRDWYVSPLGSDTADGSLQHPFATVHRAQLAIRSSQPLKQSATVWLRGGVYGLEHPWAFTPGDSGTERHRVEIRNYRGEEVRIQGAKSLKLTWTPFRNGIQQAVVSEEQRKQVDFDQLFVNGQPLRMARYPNFDPSAKYLGGTAADAILPERTQRWEHPEDALVHALHRHEWGDFHYRVLGRNPDGSLRLEGGWQNNRQLGMHQQHRFVENVFEELDAPGEWFYDSRKSILYCWPPAGVDLASATVSITHLENLVEFRGSPEAPVKFVTVRGLILEQTSRTFMKNREPLLRSDWTTYRGGVVHWKGSEQCGLEECALRWVGGNAAYVDGFNRAVRIRSCLFEEIGVSGICLVGETNAVRSPAFEYGQTIPLDQIDRTPGPRSQNYPADCLIEENLIRRCGRVEKQSAAVQIAMSMSITVRHNTLHDLPRAGINIGDGCWGGHHIEFNDIFDTVQETGDHGSFNSWGRERYWLPDIQKVNRRMKEHPDLNALLDALLPTYLENNRWRCDHGWDIDLDDGSSHFVIRNNLCLNGGLKLREGYHRRVENNVMVNNSFHPHVWFQESDDVFTHNLVMKPYAPIGMPKRWGREVDWNILPDAATLQAEQSAGRDLHSIAASATFLDPARGDYRLPGGHPAFKVGFRNLPRTVYGVTTPKLRSIAGTPIFPSAPSSGLSSESSGQKKLNWLGATAKGIEGLGERSAAGLEKETGVALLSVPEGSVAARLGFQARDVLLTVQGRAIRTAGELLEVFKSIPDGQAVSVIWIRNQTQQTVVFPKPQP